MENLELMYKDEIIHSIPRNDIEVNVDFAAITSQLVKSASHHDWICSVLSNHNNIATRLYFKEKYMAEGAYALYGYFFKQQIKKIS